jgi:hypothetical protein
LLMPTLLTKTVSPVPALNMAMLYRNGLMGPFVPVGALPTNEDMGPEMSPGATVTVTVFPEVIYPPMGGYYPVNPMATNDAGDQRYPLGMNFDFLRLDHLKDRFRIFQEDPKTAEEWPPRIQRTHVSQTTEVASTIEPITYTLVSAFSQQVIHVTAPPVSRHSGKGASPVMPMPVSTEARIKTVTLIHEQLPQKDLTREEFHLDGKGLPGGEPFEWAEGKATMEQRRFRELSLKRISDNQFLLVEGKSVLFDGLVAAVTGALFAIALLF